VEEEGEEEKGGSDAYRPCGRQGKEEGAQAFLRLLSVSTSPSYRSFGQSKIRFSWIDSDAHRVWLYDWSIRLSVAHQPYRHHIQALMICPNETNRTCGSTSRKAQRLRSMCTVSSGAPDEEVTRK
jgi:hypothetical protein